MSATQSPERAELLATLDALRKQVKSGEVECVAIVAITPTTIIAPLYVGEPQPASVILACAIALTARANELVVDSIEDDEESLPDAFAENDDGRAN